MILLTILSEQIVKKSSIFPPNKISILFKYSWSHVIGLSRELKLLSLQNLDKNIAVKTGERRGLSSCTF